MDNTIVKCNKCGKGFSVQLRSKDIQDGITETFFVCQNCGIRYHCYYDDVETKQIKNRINRYYSVLSRAKTREEKRKVKKLIEKSQIRLQNELKRIEKKVRK